MLEPTSGNVVKCAVDTLMYVVLSKAQTHLHYGELVGTIEYMTL